jgi:CubicO group peptidase (beta-lactamase class C family)
MQVIEEKKMRRLTLWLLLVVTLVAPVAAQPDPSQVINGYVRQTIAECDVPAMGAVWVRNAGQTMYYHQAGIRRVGEPAANYANNAIRQDDRFDLGSIGKVFTGLLTGRMVDRYIEEPRTPGFTFQTTLGQVFPELPNPNNVPTDNLDSVRTYMNVPIRLFLVHSSGMPYNPFSEPGDQWMPSDSSIAHTDANVMERRYKFVQAAVVDSPLFPPGTGYTYGGGTIVVGAMLERLTGTRFENLMHQHIFQPLYMTESCRYGRASYGDLAGLWQHSFVDGNHVPDTNTAHPNYNFQSHSPAGTLGCSAHGVAVFLSEWLRPDPRVITPATRLQLLNNRPASASPHVLGAWQANMPFNASGARFHSGDNGTMFAYAEITPSQGTGFAAFVNANNTIGGAAVGDLLASLKTLERDYAELFGTGSVIVPEAAFPSPAAVRTGRLTTRAFARKHNGTVVMFSTADNGRTWARSTPLGAIFTSGLGAAASADGLTVYVAGRGTDDLMWLYRSDDGGASWQDPSVIQAGVFLSGPAVATTSDGATVHVFGLGQDKKIWVSTSADRGVTWNNWAPIGNHVFTSAPAAACTPDGAVHVFGRGANHRIYGTLNTNWRRGWAAPTWRQMAAEYATSSPAVMVANDGQTMQLGMRDTGRRVSLLYSNDAGRTWARSFVPLTSDQFFTSAPTLLANDSPTGVSTLVIGENHRLFRNVWTGVWSGWSQVANDLLL